MLRISGLSMSALLSDPTVAGPVAFAIAQCASGYCIASDAASVGLYPPTLVTASDISISNVTDPNVFFEGSIPSRRLLGSLTSRRNLRQRIPIPSGLSFASGMVHPISINPAFAPRGASPRRLDWYSDSLVAAYVPPAPASHGIPVTTRNVAAGELGIGSTQVKSKARGYLAQQSLINL